jgi:hypothetical protein
MNTTLNKSVIALKVITNLSNALAKSPTGVSFVSIKGYTNSYGEVSNNLVNVGASLTSAKYSDIETLQSLDITAFNGDSILLEKARIELINSFIAPNENRSNGQIDAYTIIAKGIKVHNQSGEIYIFGLRKSKTTLVDGVYPQVNSKPLTLAKNTLRRELKSSKFTQFKLSATSVIKLNGEELIFE